MDLIKNKYHVFNLDSAKIEGYYPKELLGIIDEIASGLRVVPSRML
jgi:hypothetical protein